MNYDYIIRENKNTLVNHAFRIYLPLMVYDDKKQLWVDYLLSGGELKYMLDSLKNNKLLPPPTACLFSTPILAGAITSKDSEIKLSAGERNCVHVNFENRSNTIWQTCEETPIFLSYHWFLASGELFHYDGLRTALSLPVAAGEVCELTLNVLSPPLPGNYFLELTAVMEGEFWFEERGFSSQKIPVHIELPKLAPHTNRIYQNLVSAIKEQKRESV